MFSYFVCLLLLFKRKVPSCWHMIAMKLHKFHAKFKSKIPEISYKVTHNHKQKKISSDFFLFRLNVCIYLKVAKVNISALSLLFKATLNTFTCLADGCCFWNLLANLNIYFPGRIMKFLQYARKNHQSNA